MEEEYENGKECTCHAFEPRECACGAWDDVDWDDWYGDDD